MPATDFVSILRTLTGHAVDLIVAGGVRAVLPILRRTLEQQT